jgi:hypothetical protein
MILLFIYICPWCYLLGENICTVEESKEFFSVPRKDAGLEAKFWENRVYVCVSRTKWSIKLTDKNHAIRTTKKESFKMYQISNTVEPGYNDIG